MYVCVCVLCCVLGLVEPRQIGRGGLFLVFQNVGMGTFSLLLLSLPVCFPASLPFCLIGSLSVFLRSGGRGGMGGGSLWFCGLVGMGPHSISLGLLSEACSILRHGVD